MGNNSSVISYSDLLSLDSITRAHRIFALSFKDLYQSKDDLLYELSFYQPQIEQVNSAFFSYLTDQQKRALSNRLYYIYALLYVQCRIDLAEDKLQDLQDNLATMNKCSAYISQLQLSNPLFKMNAKRDLHNLYPEVLLLNPLSKLMVDEGKELNNNQTQIIKQWISNLNGPRLDWVWDKSLLNSILPLLPNNFFYKTQTKNALDSSFSIGGYLSWGLYYIRFAVNFGLLLKHTVDGSWTSTDKADLNLSFSERFNSQWQERKFTLINDFVWATANLACFFWLTGVGLRGVLGDGLTAVLLLMDASLATWRFYEERAEYNKRIAKLNQLLAELQRKEYPSDSLLGEDLNHQIEQLKKLIAKTEKNYYFQESKNTLDLLYAISLFVSFLIMVGFFAPLPAPLIFSMVGATLCFLLTIANAGISSYMEISKIQKEIEDNKIDFKTNFEEFATLSKKPELSEAEKNQLKYLYLEIQRLENLIIYQEQNVSYQTKKLMLSIVTDVLVPAVLFFSFMFLTAGPVFQIILALALAKFSPFILQVPKNTEPLPQLVQTQYANFAEKSKDRTAFCRFFPKLETESTSPSGSSITAQPVEPHLSPLLSAAAPA